MGFGMTESYLTNYVNARSYLTASGKTPLPRDRVSKIKSNRYKVGAALAPCRDCLSRLQLLDQDMVLSPPSLSTFKPRVRRWMYADRAVTVLSSGSRDGIKEL